jgi:nucleoside-diphosphate-sugar epimerase
MDVSYGDRRVLITGGLGFIGSNLALRMVDLGAKVTVVDSQAPGCGANIENLKPAGDAVRVVLGDIAEVSGWEDAIATADVIFNLAGEISHVESMRDPRRDLRLNTVSQLGFLEAVCRLRPGVRIVYAGTRQVYGVPVYLPVDENHPINPVDFNGIHKYAATMYHQLLARNGLLDAAVLRLTNVYGPRMSMQAGGQGFLPGFVRRLLAGQGLEVFGDGKQLRDPLFVADAVRAFELAGAARRLPSRAYNVGGPQALSLLEIAHTLAEAAGGAEVSLRPFPPEHKAFDIGSYSTDSQRIGAELGWKPAVAFPDGARRTLSFYRAAACAPPAATAAPRDR